MVRVQVACRAFGGNNTEVQVVRHEMRAAASCHTFDLFNQTAPLLVCVQGSLLFEGLSMRTR